MSLRTTSLYSAGKRSMISPTDDALIAELAYGARRPDLISRRIVWAPSSSISSTVAGICIPANEVATAWRAGLTDRLGTRVRGIRVEDEDIIEQVGKAGGVKTNSMYGDEVLAEKIPSVKRIQEGISAVRPHQFSARVYILEAWLDMVISILTSVRL